MTDKELIKQEIERLYAEVSQKPYNGEVEGEMCAYDKLLSFIDSLPEEPTVKGITWKDVNILDTLINQVRYEFPNGIGEKSFGLAVLEKFQDYQDDIEEPASDDLDFQTFAKEMHTVFALPSSETKNTEENPFNWEYAIARHFAEWQKQQMMKDAQLGIIEERADGLLGWNTVYGTDVDYRNYLLSHFKNGDKVKLIIIKED